MFTGNQRIGIIVEASPGPYWPLNAISVLIGDLNNYQKFAIQC